MKRGNARILQFSIVVSAACVLLCGCRRQDENYVYPRTIPEGASPVYSWTGSHDDILSFWGDRSLNLTVKAYFPEGWKQPGDGYWDVCVTTEKGREAPMIGVVLWQPTMEGSRRSLIVPSIDLSKFEDGLYTVIDPNVTVENGRIVRIEPVALVPMIRNHMFTPFRPKVLLVPETESELTPAPDLPPPKHDGTPFPAE